MKKKTLTFLHSETFTNIHKQNFELSSYQATAREGKKIGRIRMTLLKVEAKLISKRIQF
jgi:hypothetical protein